MRLAEEPTLRDVVSVLEHCTGLPAEVLGEAALEAGLVSAGASAFALVATCFDRRAEEHDGGETEEYPSSSDDAERGRLPANRMTGQAVSLWGISPSVAWQMTVPEWWDAADAHVRANTPKDGTGSPGRLSTAERKKLRAISDAAPDRIEPQPQPREVES